MLIKEKKKANKLHAYRQSVDSFQSAINMQEDTTDNDLALVNSFNTKFSLLRQSRYSKEGRLR